ncbi:YibE/F family protein [Nocardioides sp. Bht2]|uniref:YibE/F family protein n=1 Tax=Nocardioides sp. Bht2 TaxID=3392297 RepID=UPI0039B50A58
MGGSHRSGHDLTIETAHGPRRLLLGFLAVVAALSVVGTVWLWPSSDDQPTHQEFAAEGVSFLTATVVSVAEPCPVIRSDVNAPPEERQSFPEHCNEVVVRPESGSAKGREVTVMAGPEAARAGVEAGDSVRITEIPPAVEGAEPMFTWFGIERSFPLGLLTIGFVLVVAVVARIRGILALIGLGFAALVVGKFMLPALMAGENGTGVALAGSTLIMFVVLYLTHGASIRTSTALAGTLVGIAITALLGFWVVDAARLSGVSDEGAERLSAFVTDISFQGLLMSAVIIAGLGVLNDVTITQSSAIWELRAAGPELTRRQLFTSGMRIGRDHIASTIYTIVFAYAGTGLMVLMLLSLYDRSLLDTLTDSAMAEEVARTLVTAIGLVLAVPVTTAIAAATVSGPTTSGEQNRAGSDVDAAPKTH